MRIVLDPSYGHE